jgi:hypothetical protein
MKVMVKVGLEVLCVLGFCKSAMDWDLGVGQGLRRSETNQEIQTLSGLAESITSKSSNKMLYANVCHYQKGSKRIKQACRAECKKEHIYENTLHGIGTGYWCGFL